MDLGASGMATRYLTYVIVPLCEKEPYEENICFFKKKYNFSKNIYTFFKNICYSYVLLENICLTYVIVPLCAARAQGAAHKGPAITSNIGQIYALI